MDVRSVIPDDVRSVRDSGRLPRRTLRVSTWGGGLGLFRSCDTGRVSMEGCTGFGDSMMW